MTIDTMIEAMTKEIKQSLLLLCAKNAQAPLSALTAEQVAQGIQHTIATAGRAAFKAFLESKEEPNDVVVVDGEAYRFKTWSTKEFISLWGKISLSRKLFQNASDTKTYAPLDAAWAMEEEYLAMEVREAVAFACAFSTPEETALLFEKTAMFQVHPTLIKRALERVEACVAPRREAVDQRIRQAQEAPVGSRVVVASMDGANVMMRAKGKKQGRPGERPGVTGDEETNTAYKNAMVGVVSFYGEVAQGDKCPKRLDARYVSHMPEQGAPTFKEKFEAEVAQALAHCQTGIAKVLLCDAARPIWKYAEANPLLKDFEMLVDYWHSLEHLSLAAEAIFGKSTNKAKNWYHKYAKKLKEEDGGAQSILLSIGYHAKASGLSASRQKALAVQRTFFKRNKAKMTYADFRRRGLPIGSGPVEAACKTLVKARLCRSGMRWSQAGGQRILDLRTYVKSNRWNAFWKQYKELKCAV